jgi:UrcA family protein
MHSLTRTLIGAIVALLICGAEAALFAADASAADLPQSLSVHYADLNLDRPADVATLYHRIAAAAEYICRPRLLTGQHLPEPGYQVCFNDAVTQAVARVDRPALSAYHQQRLELGPQRAATIAQR